MKNKMTKTNPRKILEHYTNQAKLYKASPKSTMKDLFIRGLDVSINTTASNDEECYWLLKEFGFPLREKPLKTQNNEGMN